MCESFFFHEWVTGSCHAVAQPRSWQQLTGKGVTVVHQSHWTSSNQLIIVYKFRIFALKNGLYFRENGWFGKMGHTFSTAFVPPFFHTHMFGLTFCHRKRLLFLYKKKQKSLLENPTFFRQYFKDVILKNVSDIGFQKNTEKKSPPKNKVQSLKKYTIFLLVLVGQKSVTLRQNRHLRTCEEKGGVTSSVTINKHNPKSFY